MSLLTLMKLHEKQHDGLVSVLGIAFVIAGQGSVRVIIDDRTSWCWQQFDKKEFNLTRVQHMTPHVNAFGAYSCILKRHKFMSLWEFQVFIFKYFCKTDDQIRIESLRVINDKAIKACDVSLKQTTTKIEPLKRKDFRLSQTCNYRYFDFSFIKHRLHPSAAKS